MKQESSRGQVAGNVPAAEVVGAVRDMLAAAGLPMGADQISLLEHSLTLQEQLTAVDTALIEEQVCLQLTIMLLYTIIDTTFRNGRIILK